MKSFKNTCFQNVGIIETETGGEIPSENKEFIIGNGTGCVVGSWHRNLTTTGHQTPFTIIADDS